MQFTLADILKVLNECFITFEEAKTLVRGHLNLDHPAPVVDEPAPALPEPEHVDIPAPEVTEAETEATEAAQ
jgi:hypothetical protein